MTGPKSAASYFEQIDEFVAATLGDAARRRYQIIIDDPQAVASHMRDALEAVREFRAEHGDAYYFNWRLAIEADFQQPFVATHRSMAALQIHEDQAPHALAANLRRAFSGIVSGNVREDTAALIERDGPFVIDGSPRIMQLLDRLLAAFVAQKRMKIAASRYQPCYRIA